MVTADAVNVWEVLEGMRVSAKTTAPCTEMSIEADPQRPHFFDMCSATRRLGGPSPDDRYLLAMISGVRSYRITGDRGGTAYLSFQVLAGAGLNPRRMSADVGDDDTGWTLVGGNAVLWSCAGSTTLIPPM